MNTAAVSPRRALWQDREGKRRRAAFVAARAPCGRAREKCARGQDDQCPLGGVEIIMESLILAQNERWRRVLSMQVVRDCGACPA